MGWLQGALRGAGEGIAYVGSQGIEEQQRDAALKRQFDFSKFQDELQQARDARLSTQRVSEHKQTAAINTDEAVRAQNALLPGRVAEVEQVGKAKNAVEAASPMTYQGRRLDPTTGGMIDVRDPADVALDRKKTEAGIDYTKAGTDNVREQGRRTDETNRSHLSQEAIKREQILAKDVSEARKELSKWMSENPRPDPKKSGYAEKLEDWAKRKQEAVGSRVSELETELKAHRSKGSTQEPTGKSSSKYAEGQELQDKEGNKFVVRDGKPVALNAKEAPAEVGSAPKEAPKTDAPKGFIAKMAQSDAEDQASRADPGAKVDAARAALAELKRSAPGLKVGNQAREAHAQKVAELESTIKSLMEDYQKNVSGLGAYRGGYR